MKHEESVDRSFDEIVMDVQWKLQKLSSALSRYPGYEREIAGDTEPASKNNPDQPRDDLGRWTTGGGNGGASDDNSESDDIYSEFGGNSGMHIDKAVDYLDKHAREKSEGKCATRVRGAIEEGGVTLKKHPIPAKEYHPYLEKYFDRLTPTPEPDYKPQKGDIAIFQNIAGHPDGHIQMYNGK